MRFTALMVGAFLLFITGAWAQTNLCPDPSVEEIRPKNQFGVPFAKWGGWLFEGPVEFRNGLVARTGRYSAELVGTQGGKLRVYTPTVALEPGRYRFAFYMRGLDVGPGVWGTNEDVNFGDDKYYPLKVSGTFGWTRIELVKQIPAKAEIKGCIGLWGCGRLWVDDAEIVRVADDSPLTDKPTVGSEEHPVQPPGAIDPAKAVHCPDCGYRNMPEWSRCYACGAELKTAVVSPAGPDAKPLTTLAAGKTAPFGEAPNVAVVSEHARPGTQALRLDRDYVVWDGRQDWSGYDYWKADVYNASSRPIQLLFEVHDDSTTDYWTRVNYWTVLPPGASTVTIPTDLYVGEKSRPGRRLDLNRIKRLALGISQPGPVFFSDFRVERDKSDSVKVPGLMAFSFGPGGSPPMRGFTQVTPSTAYSPGRGYGFVDARIWRAFDMTQPDPLYQVGICVEAGGFRIDLPNGRYRVFVNLDSPSGFWGEYQTYTRRKVKANGVTVVDDRMDFQAFVKRYFRFSDVDDSPLENTFDKYQRPYFAEKRFEVEVKDGKLLIEFEGENWANFVSALVVYPQQEAGGGERYLDNMRERRRFAFDNYFKRVLPSADRDAIGPIPPFQSTAKEKQDGLVLFARNWMVDTPVNAVPRRSEVVSVVKAFASAGQMEPLVFSALPLRDLGAAHLMIGDLIGPGGLRIPASAIHPGVVSHRITRVTAEGTVYTISPRFVMPRTSADLNAGVATTFWLTLHVPLRVKAGTYRGKVALTLADGSKHALDLQVRLFATPLAPLDVPAGPWGCTIDLPWPGPEADAYNRAMFQKSLARMREYGLTAFSGIPTIAIRGWKDKQPDIDFSRADWEMAQAKAAGFRMAVNYNGGIRGFDNYFVDEGAKQNAGFADYRDFLRAVLKAVDAHAKAAGWIPFAFNLCDEPIGDAVPRSTENARAWRDAAPAGILTTGATSISVAKPDDPHMGLGKALKIANLNDHDEAAIRALHEAGGDWAFYNGGDRWTFGAYMYKCAKQYGMEFRLSWHWNASAGDPYYALDCREDDYSWCAGNANGELVPSVHFERDIRAGVDDYRYMLTLANLLRRNPNHPAAATAKQLLESKLAAFKLGERDHNAKWPPSEYSSFRLRLAEAIEKLSE